MSTVPVRPTDTVPRHALRRGTRGFAAVVLFLIAVTVFAIAFFVLPSSPLGRLELSWLIPLAIAFGIAHLAAIYGVVRRRGWVVSLTLYLAAIGVGLSAFGLLLTLTGADPFAPTSTLPAEQARADGLGLLVWLIGTWIVAARFVVRGMAVPVTRPVEAAEAVGVAAVHRAPTPAPDLRRRSLLASGHGSAS